MSGCGCTVRVARCEETPRCRAWTFAPPHFTTPYNLEDAACILRFGLTSADGSSNGFTPVGWHDGMRSAAAGSACVRRVGTRRNSNSACTYVPPSQWQSQWQCCACVGMWSSELSADVVRTVVLRRPLKVGAYLPAYLPHGVNRVITHCLQ